jgi:hypothetical protein
VAAPAIPWPGRARRLAAPVLGRAAPLAAALVRRARGRRAVAAVVAGVAVVLGAMAAVGLGGAGHPARTSVPRAALVPGYGTRAARWLGGPAGHLLSAVTADLGRLAVAERSGRPGPARQAGLRLSTDAKAALLGPAPPLSGRLYRAALTELERAGRSAEAGRFRAAAASLRAGESTITKATAIANSPATPGLPVAPVTEPGGR